MPHLPRRGPRVRRVRRSIIPGFGLTLGPAIREQFQQALVGRLNAEYDRAYLPIPKELATGVLAERRVVEGIAAETSEVSEWLAARESAAHVGELYGHSGERTLDRASPFP